MIDEERRQECSWGELLAALSEALIYTPAWREWEGANPGAAERIRLCFPNELRARVDNLVPAPYSASVSGDRLNALHWCAAKRACHGAVDNFWERLFGLYAEGLWPCGREGEW